MRQVVVSDDEDALAIPRAELRRQIQCASYDVEGMPLVPEEFAVSLAKLVIAELEPRCRAAAWQSWKRRLGELKPGYPLDVLPWDAEQDHWLGLLDTTGALLQSMIDAGVPPEHMHGFRDAWAAWLDAKGPAPKLPAHGTAGAMSPSGRQRRYQFRCSHCGRPGASVTASRKYCLGTACKQMAYQARQEARQRARGQ